MMQQALFTGVSLFCGCGGSDVGLAQAGGHVVAAIDHDAWCVRSYEANHLNTRCIQYDVRAVSSSLLQTWCGGQAIDVVIGSPPCQGYSTEGQRDILDSRNVLYLDFVRLATGLSPSLIVMENVVGMARGQMAPYLLDAKQCLQAAGYVVKVGVVDAADYGVPQRRRRVFVVAVHQRVGVLPAFPVRTGTVCAFYPDSDGDGPSVSDTLHASMRRRKAMQYLAGASRGYQVVQPGQLLPTVVASLSGTAGLFVEEDDGRLRRLSIAEVLRAQGFPPEYQIVGSYRQAIRQLGNAVPPPVMAAMLACNHAAFLSSSEGRVWNA